MSKFEEVEIDPDGYYCLNCPHCDYNFFLGKNFLDERSLSVAGNLGREETMKKLEDLDERRETPACYCPSCGKKIFISTESLVVDLAAMPREKDEEVESLQEEGSQ